MEYLVMGIMRWSAVAAAACLVAAPASAQTYYARQKLTPSKAVSDAPPVAGVPTDPVERIVAALDSGVRAANAYSAVNGGGPSTWADLQGYGGYPGPLLEGLTSGQTDLNLYEGRLVQFFGLADDLCRKVNLRYNGVSAIRDGARSSNAGCYRHSEHGNIAYQWYLATGRTTSIPEAKALIEALTVAGGGFRSFLARTGRYPSGWGELEATSNGGPFASYPYALQAAGVVGAQDGLNFYDGGLVQIFHTREDVCKEITYAFHGSRVVLNSAPGPGGCYRHGTYGNIAYRWF